MNGYPFSGISTHQRKKSSFKHFITVWYAGQGYDEEEVAMKVSEKLFGMGINFRRGEEVFPIPIDDANPSLPASKYFLDKAALERLCLAWSQWKRFAQKVLNKKRGRGFISHLFLQGTTERWGDWERSELGSFMLGQSYFVGPHVTRIDFGLDRDGRLVIIDPNVMPYGIAPMVAVQEMLNINTHEKYLEQLSVFSPTWIADRSHGNACGIRWLTGRAGSKFSFVDEFVRADNVVRQTRKDVNGTQATVGAPGIRVFESQIWAALLSIPGLPKYFGFDVDLNLHRNNCAPCFLIKLQGTKLDVAFSFYEGSIQWMKFDDFMAIRWSQEYERVFVKCLSTSGCRQVNVSQFNKSEVIRAINNKLGHYGYFLLQPALPCLVDGERVRVASYLGLNNEHYGSEVTRVPGENNFAHLGGHAKLSYLVL